MRLAFCNATRRWGGVKTWSIEFAAALRELGHELILYGRDSAFIDRARAHGLEAYAVAFGCDYNPLSTAYFYRQFQSRRIQAVLVNVGKDLRTAGLAARLLNLPLVQRIGLPRDMRDSLTTRLSHRLLRPHYLCPCRYIRNGLLEALPFVHEDDTSVVYSAKNPLPEIPDRVNSPLRILSSSQVNANKGHKELAHTLALLKKEGHAFHWDVAGEGDCLEELRALCATLGLEKEVTLHGFTQNLSALLRAGDVFVLSSYTEGLPNTLLEGMASGLAPVGRSVGGVRECWPDALPFLLVPYAGWEQDADWHERAGAGAPALPLYAPLRQVLCASPEQTLQWKREAWEHCRTNFALPVQAKKLESFFEQRLARIDKRRVTG